MNLSERIRSIESTVTSRLAWAPPLMARFVVGWVFLWAGWGKLNNLPAVIGYFDSLGIPLANVQAPFVSGLEFVGGAMLLAGIAVRYISFPLIGTMVVAILTAKRAEVGGLSDLFSLSEFLYIVLLAYLIVAGAGAVALPRVFGFRPTTEEARHATAH